MTRLLTSLSALCLLSLTLGCPAQPPPGATLSPALARRVEILIRGKVKLPPDYLLSVGPRRPSDVPGFSTIAVTFTSPQHDTTTVDFLLSQDGQTLAQLNKFDLSKDPKTLVSGAGRPGRGGPESAPVQIVGFDDLECPFCARMNAQLFPALTERYGDKVHVTYLDYPESRHPWAMRAAVDVNCVAAQDPKGYWALVDHIHAHADEFGGQEKSLQKALDQIDAATLDEAKKDHLKVDVVEACIKKQDQTAIQASMKRGDDLGVEATPELFINGEKLEGAYPLEDVFRFVDAALVAEGITPPPPYVPPAKPAPTPTAQPAAAPASSSAASPAAAPPAR